MNKALMILAGGPNHSAAGKGQVQPLLLSPCPPVIYGQAIENVPAGLRVLLRGLRFKGISHPG